MVSTLPFNALGVCLIPDWGAKIPHALQLKDHSLKQKQYCNKFNKDFKNDPHQKKSLKKERERRLYAETWKPTGVKYQLHHFLSL